jgi:cation transporter-like permease
LRASARAACRTPVSVTVRQRLPWLAVNLVTAILASLVIAQFEEAISQIVALAVLMPIVASMGGNAGTQALTVAVRALATRDLTSSNTLRVVRREALVGLVNGLAFAAIMGVVAALWFGSPGIGAVIAVAMVLTLVAAAVAGVLIPLALDRMGVDPAVASGPFVTTVTDVVAFLAFLGIAAGGAPVTDIAAAKVAARKAAFARRAAAHAQGGDAAAQAALRAFLGAGAGRVLAGYLPIRTEIDPLPVMAGWDGPVGVPVIEGKGLPLRFRLWRPGCAMVEGPFGVHVPEGGEEVVPES